ncbi:MAG: diaminopropionate ammonia-lyase, partial [Gammaproteobacteria bacterium]|nr:diaminopropionate ammonia-lyase [Gammaproteobacteria bacterium]
MTDVLAAHAIHLYHNVRAAQAGEYGPAQRATLNPEEAEAARREIGTWPGFAPTPLVSLPGLATAAGLGSVAYKDEGGRFGLRSFKALGGAYAVYRLLAREAERTGTGPVTAASLAAGKHPDLTSRITVCCATDGNHGRSVAWGAQTFGCACTIFIHATVSEQREAAIAAYGARVVRHPGNYDQAVHRAAQEAEKNGWVVVSDTSYEGYTDIPRDVMHGYTVMADEALRAHAAKAGGPPTHIFVQGGVGGAAAAVLARFWWEYGTKRPRFGVVEPEKAACLYESARADKRVALTGDIETVMAGLSCGETSLLAWPILHQGAEFFLTIADDAALDVMRILADGVGGDPPVVAGESATAGLAGVLAAIADGDAARTMGLGPDSRVLVFGTEGDTDPELYEQIVGR